MFRHSVPWSARARLILDLHPATDSNAISHWLGANLESALICICFNKLEKPAGHNSYVTWLRTVHMFWNIFWYFWTESSTPRIKIIFADLTLCLLVPYIYIFFSNSNSLFYQLLVDGPEPHDARPTDTLLTPTTICFLHFVLSTKTMTNTVRPRQNGRHFSDAIFKCIFLNENV